MKHRKRQAHTNHERWLVSYADFITLLFAFFVVMFASSQVNKQKVGSLAAYFEAYIRDGNARLPTPVPAEKKSGTEPSASAADLAAAREALARELSSEISQGAIELSLEPRGLILSLRESALFPPGRDTFDPGAAPILTKAALALHKLPRQPVRLEGHTDDVPIQTTQFPSNWELSAARATAVLELLTSQLGIDPARLAVAGYADNRPIARNDTPHGRARNRRVDIVVLSRSAAEMEPKQVQAN